MNVVMVSDLTSSIARSSAYSSEYLVICLRCLHVLGLVDFKSYDKYHARAPSLSRDVKGPFVWYDWSGKYPSG